MSDMTNAAFYTFGLLLFLLFIISAPLLPDQKTYFWWIFGGAFLYYPLLVLRHING
jgi:hypothetical protein